MRIIGRRMSQINVVADTDRVLFAYPLPAGCTLKSVFLNCRFMGTEDSSILTAQMYGMSGFVLPILDPDAEGNVDTIWDQLVPKDTVMAAGSFDVDTGASDTNPEFEIGVPDPNAVFGFADNEPLEIFRRRRLITVADSPIGYGFKDGTTDTYVPIDRFTTLVKNQVKAKMHSYVMFGVSAPDMSNTGTAIESVISEEEWYMMTYIETVMERAALHQMGLIEATAETPYEEATALIAELIEARPLEDTAGRFATSVWNVFGQATFAVDVPGVYKPGSLSSE